MRRNSNERLELFDNRKDLKRHSIGGYSHSQQIKVSPEDRAAIKIQSEIRGYLTRKHLENEKKQNKNAATKIQAYIRGYLTRKHLEEKGVIITPPRSRTSTNARYEIENN
ncbi:RIIa domain-containing protein [Meloidogyne graminicola]|uniref:RIIa domain-containing protein n=1 Tax=Meloidogyne graminicola TaxID=189291 RepID=A0A8S9ZE74_9BILA|nr:RIIa domain-containing protein [Meloidogyne graminicola]